MDVEQIVEEQRTLKSSERDGSTVILYRLARDAGPSDQEMDLLAKVAGACHWGVSEKLDRWRPWRSGPYETGMDPPRFNSCVARAAAFAVPDLTWGVVVVESFQHP